MAERKLFAMVFKGDEDCEVWYPEIPMNEPLLKALFEKYRHSGGSDAGNSVEVCDLLQSMLED